MRVVNWITGHMGNENVDLMYQSMHFITLGVVISVLAFFLIIAKSKRVSDEVKNSVLKGIAWFHLGFEILWRVLYIIFNNATIIDLWPKYACNLNGIIVPIICLLDWKTGKKIFYSFALIGGCATFINPEGIFSNTVFVFPILKSILQHTGLLLIPLFEFTTRKYLPSVKDYPWTVFGILIHILNCEVIARLLGGKEDYLYLRSGLPFTVEGFPSWIITLTSALIFVFLFMFFVGLKKKNHE